MVSTRAPRRQFDVFVNPDPDTSKTYPYLLVLQSNAITTLDTCIVAPLTQPKSLKYFERLMPQIAVDGRQYTIAMPDMAAVHASTIGTAIANLEPERYRIVRAIDLIFTGA